MAYVPNRWKLDQVADLAHGGQAPAKRFPDTLMLPGDDRAHTWRVTVLDDGVPADLSNVTADAWMVRSDRLTKVYLRGTISDNVISVTLDPACYAYPGDLVGVMRILDGSTRLTLAVAIFRVGQPMPTDVVDPGGIVPNLDKLLAQVARLEAANAQAETLIRSNRARFRVASWNVGNFAYGDLSGGEHQSSNRRSNVSGRRGPIGSDTMYDQMLGAFEGCNANLYLFCEWNRYWNKNWTDIDETQDVEAMSVLAGLKPFWTVHNPVARTDKYAGHKIASDWPIIREYAAAYGSDEDRYFVGAVCAIAGREVHFVSVHLNPNAAGSASDIDEGGTENAKTRRREFKILTDYLASIGAEYVVLGGDFNTGGPSATAASAAEDLQMLADAGYTCMQGGFFGKRADGGLFDTLNADEWPRGTSPIRPYDNIAVNAKLAIVGARVVAENGSDHYPVVAEIVFNDATDATEEV